MANLFEFIVFFNSHAIIWDHEVELSELLDLF